VAIATVLVKASSLSPPWLKPWRATVAKAWRATVAIAMP
jgi:hypothetical protein